MNLYKIEAGEFRFYVVADGMATATHLAEKKIKTFRIHDGYLPGVECITIIARGEGVIVQGGGD